MTIRLRLHVPGVPAGAHADINVCEDCPAFRDPDPRPCYCALDIAWQFEDAATCRARGGVRRVVVGGPIPSNCPLLTLHVEVLERDPNDTPEAGEP